MSFEPSELSINTCNDNDNDINDGSDISSNILDISMKSTGALPTFNGYNMSRSLPPEFQSKQKTFIKALSPNTPKKRPRSINTNIETNPNNITFWKFVENEIEFQDISQQSPSNERILNIEETNIKKNNTFSFDDNTPKVTKTVKKKKKPIPGKFPGIHVERPETAQDRVYNVFLLFFDLEKCIWNGFFMCLDSFLLVLIILPMRVIYRILFKIRYYFVLYFYVGYYNGFNYYLNYMYIWIKYKVILNLFYRIFYCKQMRYAKLALNSNEYIDQIRKLNSLIKDKFSEFYDKYGSGAYVYSGRDYLDLVRLLTTILCVAVLSQFNLSQIYHMIRGQESFKLYVLFKILNVIEKLFQSFGSDVMESLYVSLLKRNNLKHILINVSIFIGYSCLHSLLLYCHVITLNAAINDNNNTLITLLVTDNFYELKSTVFKRYEVQNVFQIVCSDIVERFEIFLYVLLILLQNMCFLGFESIITYKWGRNALYIFSLMLGLELFVDLFKHGFIVKYNNLPIFIYKSFYIRLSIDFMKTRNIKSHNSNTNSNNKNISHIISSNNSNNSNTNNNNNSFFFMDRRLGFPSLPLNVLFLRVLLQVIQYYLRSHDYARLGLIGLSTIVALILYTFKLWLSLIMLGESIRKIGKKGEYYNIARQLNNVYRYSMIVKRIPC